MSHLIDNYLAQEKAKEQKQLEYEHERRTASLLDFADQMDDGKIVHYSDVIEKLMKNGHATDISGFHDIATTHNTYYIYDKTHDLLARADETDLKKHRFYKIIARIQTSISYITFVSLIALLYAVFSGTVYEAVDIIKASLIIISAYIVNSLLFFLNAEYHQKYKLYGIKDK